MLDAMSVAGLLLIPAEQEPNALQMEQALHRVQSSSYTWIVFGGRRSSLEPLFATGKARRVNSRDLLADKDAINETARLWAREWCHVPAMRDLLTAQGCNLGESLHRELVYCFLAVIKQAYCLTHRLAQGTIAQCLVLGPQGWEEIAPDKLEALAPAWVGKTSGVRRMVIEESKPGWREALKRQSLWIRDIHEWGILISSPLRSPLSRSLSTGSAQKSKSPILIAADPKVVRPVIEELAQQGHPMILLRPLLAFKPMRELAQYGIKSRVYADYLTAPMRQKVRQEQQRMQTSKEQALEAVQNSRVFHWRGQDWFDAVRLQLDYVLGDYLPTLLGYFFLTHQLIDQEKIAGILVDEDVCEFNRTLVTAAGTRGVPSVVIQHGAPYDLQPTGLSPVSARKIAAWGAYSEECFRRWGVPAEKIALTGAPRYDRIDRGDEQAAREKVAAAAGWDEKCPLIVYACDPYHREGREDYAGIPSSKQEEEEHMLCFMEGIASYPDCFGVLKQHPKDNDAQWIHTLMQGHAAQKRLSVLRHFPTLELLLACDVLVTAYSTVAMEAMLLDKPVITVNLTGQPDLQPHAELGAALPVLRREDMAGVLREVLDNEQTRSRLRQSARKAVSYYFSADNVPAAKRVAALLTGMIQRPS